MSNSPVSQLMTRMKNIARGAESTICRIELIAMRMAHYSISPPAKLCPNQDLECVGKYTLNDTLSGKTGFIPWQRTSQNRRGSNAELAFVRWEGPGEAQLESRGRQTEQVGRRYSRLTIKNGVTTQFTST